MLSILKNVRYTILLFLFCTNCVSEQHDQTSILVSTVQHSMDTASIKKPTLNPKDTIQVLVLPCANGYDYSMKGFDLDQLLEDNLRKLNTIKVLDFPHKTMQGINYLGIYDKKYCDPIIQKTTADFLVLNRIHGNLFPIENRTNSWGYETKIVNTKTKQEYLSISASNLKDFKALEVHITTNINQLIATK